ncbi:transglycosylase SLT domain-containing protein [Chelatococcus asaccharovorans]|uniref:Transglycosylase-like protein with SLT domain n=1 Tax=Chelatococcus asaccharovorans TaxID=28210 RepID=A0A2V3UC25_9HYPH|nr:transglycosylase SLT domain-containing protein [Chelatococcus asaccharovorans]MBS7703173.1 transglycosylase SLT domain-containing protein [Chelatococcus asaccharovorans]PXW61502.1 transglycosylase-like protein with SLT domain [Chelatococcus asaccharovorans]
MAGAPLIISRQTLGTGIQGPQLSSGQRSYQAALSGAQTEAQAAEFETRAVAGGMAQQGQAEARFGQQVAGGVTNLALMVAEAQRKTTLSQRKAQWLESTAAAQADFDADPDWQAAPERLRARQEQIDASLYEGLGEMDAQELRLDTMRPRISLNRHATQRTVAKTQDAWRASLASQTTTLLTHAASASSPTERAGVIADHDKILRDGIAAGMLGAADAQQQKQAFAGQVDNTDIIRGIRERPRETLAMLSDLNNFRSLTPVQRESFKAQAGTSVDEQTALQAHDLVKRDPTAAAATYGRNLSPTVTAAIFDRAIIPQESGGDATAVSNRGAYGIAQVMPGTARMMAPSIGRKDLVALSDGQLKAQLLADPTLNRQLGLAYFQQNVKSFGNLAAAIAAYHAGAGGAVKEAHDKALAQHGENYTPAQLISLLPDNLTDGTKKTKEYVADAFARLGADMTRGGVSTNASYRIASLVDSGLAAQDAASKRDLHDLVTATGDERNAVIASFQAGYATDPMGVLAIKQPLIAAAATGDANAANELRRFEAIEQNAPLVRQAYQMPPALLEAGVAELRAKAATGGADATEQRRLAVFESVATEVARLAKADPVQLEERAGRAPATLVAPPQDGRDPVFSQQLATRAAIAAQAASRYGSELQVLRPQEQAAFRPWFASQSPQGKVDALNAAARAMPEPAYRAFVNQVAGDDSLSATAGWLGRRDPGLAADILKGASYLQQPGIKEKLSDVRKAIAEALPGNVYPPAVAGDMIEAAIAVYAKDKAGGATFDAEDGAGLTRALERVAGHLVKVNGAYVPVPVGTADWLVQDGMRRLNAETLDRFGGAIAADGSPFDPAFIGRHAQLRTIEPGGGRYEVFIPLGGGRMAPVRNRVGETLTINLDGLIHGSRLDQADTPNAARRRARARLGEDLDALRGEGTSP